MTDRPHSETLHGSCLCGVNEYTVSGSPDLFLLCHCTYCKKDTGSAHGANLIFLSGSLAWHDQDSTKRQTFNLEGTRHTKCFCTTCGSALPYVFGDSMAVVPVGSLSQEPSVLPSAHIFCQSKARWQDHLTEIPCYDRFKES